MLFSLLFLLIVCSVRSDFDIDMGCQLDTNTFYISDGWTNGYTFDCAWDEDQVTFTGNYMNIGVDNVGCPCMEKNYRSGEVATHIPLGYGYFGAVMKIPKNADGFMSGSIFTYYSSGDEIDIEFTGKDDGLTFDVNVWNHGVMTGVHDVVDLGFDATEDFHEYGFIWTSTSITWFVDGLQVHQVTTGIPTDDMHLIVNIWPGNMEDSGIVEWLGTLAYTEPVNFYVERIRYYSGVTTYPDLCTTTCTAPGCSLDVEMTSLDTSLFTISDGWANGGIEFDAYWASSQVTFPSSEYMALTVDNVGCPTSCGGEGYRSGEVSTVEKYGEGYFGAYVQIPTDAEGMMSGSVFTYDIVSGDGISIQFAGKDNGLKMTCNYHRLGDDSGHETIVDLVSIDATDGLFHEFGFVWTSTSIIWYADGTQVHQVSSDDMPTNDMQIMVNIWPGNMDDSETEDWLGTLDYQSPVVFKVERIRWVNGATSYPCPDDENCDGDDDIEDDGSIFVGGVLKLLFVFAFLF